MYNLDLTDIEKFKSTVIGEEVLVAIFNEQYHYCYKIINEYNWPLLIRRLLNYSTLRIRTSLKSTNSNSFDFEGSFWLV